VTAVKNGFRVVRCRGAVLSDGAAFEVGAQRSKGGRVSVHSRCRPGVRALLSLQYDMLTLFRAGRAPTLRRLAVERGRTSSALPCARHRASAAALHLATRRRFLVILNTVRCAACVAPVHFELGMPWTACFRAVLELAFWWTDVRAPSRCCTAGWHLPVVPFRTTWYGGAIRCGSRALASVASPVSAACAP
jgi:hypothetical protein